MMKDREIERVGPEFERIGLGERLRRLVASGRARRGERALGSGVPAKRGRSANRAERRTASSNGIRARDVHRCWDRCARPRWGRQTVQRGKRADPLKGWATFPRRDAKGPCGRRRQVRHRPALAAEDRGRHLLDWMASEESRVGEGNNSLGHPVAIEGQRPAYLATASFQNSAAGLSLMDSRPANERTNFSRSAR